MLGNNWFRLAGRLIDGVIWAVVIGVLIAALLLLMPTNVDEIVEKLNPLPEPGWVVREHLERTGDWESPVDAIIYWLFIGWIILIFMLILEFLYLLLYGIVSVVLFAPGGGGADSTGFCRDAVWLLLPDGAVLGR